MTNLESILKNRDSTLPTNVHLVKAMVFFSSDVWMWELEYKESRASKNWCFWTVVLEKALEIPLDCKEIQPVHPIGDQSWVFIGETDVGVKLQYFGHLIRRADSLEKTLMLGMMRAGWEGDYRGWDGWMASPTQWRWVWMDSGSSCQGGLACCGSWGRKELDTTEWLNWTELND